MGTSLFTEDQVKAIIKACAEDWAYGTSLCFKFLNTDDPGRNQADIRFLFQGRGSWHVIGTTFVQFGQPTTDIGPKGIITQAQITRKVLRDFGHALGFHHDHSSPNCPLHSDRGTIMKHCKGTSPKGIALVDWVDMNFKKLQNGGGIEASSFDEQSIMLYTILPTWNHEGIYVKGSSVLSDMDREMARKWYLPRTIRRSSKSSLSSSFAKKGTRFSMIGRRRSPLAQYDECIVVGGFRCDKRDC
ncbi:hypothetical protein F5Y01DRAFT_320569 [Xylaria sp. FL0043]|nr:hypothetical protein F5Y01DRAFT_320569 [Xylaria sp. FL0043]